VYLRIQLVAMDLTIKSDPLLGKSAAIELDLGRYELRRGGRRVKIEKKPMELLIYLASRREQLVSREDIVARLWQSDLFIDTERNVNNIVRKVRTALRDDAVKPRFVETVVGKGYRFVGRIRVISPVHSSTELAEGSRIPSAEKRYWQAERSSLAVLPLHLLGNLDDNNGFCLGFADGLVARLANLEGVDVLPTSTILEVSGGASASEVAPRLGVRFVLRGAVQSSKAQARLLMELFDAHTQRNCFAKNFIVNMRQPFEHIEAVARDTARALKVPLREPGKHSQARYSRDPLAYAEFIQGYSRSTAGDRRLLEEAAQRLMNAVTRDPEFALAHAILSFVCAKLHFEIDPSRSWLEKAEFHCERSLRLDAALPEAHVANSFLLWGPSKNFQHVEAIAELKRALSLQKNLPHAYSRLGTILAHIGLLEHSRTMFERGSHFDARKSISHSIVQAYVWSGEYELAREELQRWRNDDPANKYPIYFGVEVAILTGEWKEAKALLACAGPLLEEEPMMTSLQGVLHASLGESETALRWMNAACTNPKSFGHAHHTYYQIARILSLLNRPKDAFAWLERSVDTGFACWPFFLKDPSLKNLRRQVQFELLVSSLQAKYPDHLGLL
jgi:DNA-binding winged helix-turn-helix (wHTH) protein/tetratricopeptide (TPR) repeat protein